MKTFSSLVFSLHKFLRMVKHKKSKGGIISFMGSSWERGGVVFVDESSQELRGWSVLRDRFIRTSANTRSLEGGGGEERYSFERRVKNDKIRRKKGV